MLQDTLHNGLWQDNSSNTEARRRSSAWGGLGMFSYSAPAPSSAGGMGIGLLGGVGHGGQGGGMGGTSHGPVNASD